jgi:hypothetical protein
MSAPDHELEPAPLRPGRSGARTGMRVALTVAAVVALIVGVPLLVTALGDGDGDAPSVDRRIHSDTSALQTVRAAVDTTRSAGSWETRTETQTTSARDGTCVTSPGAAQLCRRLMAGATTWVVHGIVNLDPYVLRTDVEAGTITGITSHFTATSVWQQGGATVGYANGNSGIPFAAYAQQVIGTLGPAPGALAMIGISSSFGQLALSEEAVEHAEPDGEGEVDGIHVTNYTVQLHMTRLADAPCLTSEQRDAIDQAIPILESSGYEGTTQRLGIDDAGYMREITTTHHLGDGSTSTGHSVLYNFGCAPRVYPPDQGGYLGDPIGPCVPPPTPTTTVPATAPTTSLAPPTTVGPTTTIPPITLPPTTLPPTPTTTPPTSTSSP